MLREGISRKSFKLCSFPSLCNSVLIQAKLDCLVLPLHYHAWYSLPFKADQCDQHPETEWALGCGDDGRWPLFQNTFDWWEPKWVPLWTESEALPTGLCIECLVLSWCEVIEILGGRASVEVDVPERLHSFCWFTLVQPPFCSPSQPVSFSSSCLMTS